MPDDETVDEKPETQSPLARRGELVDEEVVAEEGATGRRWGVGLAGMGVGCGLLILGSALNRSYLVYLGVAVFVIFGIIAAGVSQGWFNIPGIVSGGGTLPRRRLRRKSQGGEIRGLPKQGRRPPKQGRRPPKGRDDPPRP